MPDIFISDSSPKKEEDRQSLQPHGKNPVSKSEKEPVVLDFPKVKTKDFKKENLEQIPGHTHNPLAAYCYLPEKIDFEDKEDGETVILFLRKHFITNTGWILLTIVMLLAPLLLPHFPILSFLPLRFQFVAVLGWYLVTVALALESFLTWFFNVSIVTEKRIIDIDFVNLIYKQISDTTIDRVQDITYKMGGVIRTIFNYGDVVVETAGEIPSFTFWAVPNPDQVTKIIEQLLMKEEQEGIKPK